MPTMKGIRSRNIYKKHQEKPFEISRTKFEDFLKCKRCFYLDRVKGVNKPSSPPYTLNNLVDELLKREFDQYRADKKPHPLFKEMHFNGIPFQHDDLDKWRASRTQGIKYEDEDTNLILKGGIDDIWLDLDTNKVVIADYKATSKKDGVADDILEQPFYGSYKIQLDFYSWLFEKNGFEVADFGYFLFCNGKQDKQEFKSIMDFEYKIIKYNTDTSWIDEKVKEMKKQLDSEEIPNHSEECDFCIYSKTIKEF